MGFIGAAPPHNDAISCSLAGAFDLLRLGYGPLFPVNGIDGDGRCTCGKLACDNAGKHPVWKLAPHGFKNATTDPDAIRNWFSTRPWANIGMATGEVVVLDVDPRHGGDVNLRALEAQHGDLPRTVVALTGGGGWHGFFAPPSGMAVHCSNGRVGSGLDVKAAGGYVVAAPSLHVSGKRYRWHPKHHPDNTPLAQMPEWLVARALKPGVTAARGPLPNAALGAGVTQPGRPIAEWDKLILDGADEGGRNNAICQLTGILLHRGNDPTEIETWLLEWNATGCRPPLSPNEVRAAVSNIVARELRKRKGTRFG